jgi:hypothetical protein
MQLQYASSKTCFMCCMTSTSVASPALVGAPRNIGVLNWRVNTADDDLADCVRQMTPGDTHGRFVLGDSTATYASINLRDSKGASMQLCKDIITKLAVPDTKDFNLMPSQFRSLLHKQCSRRLFVVIVFCGCTQLHMLASTHGQYLHFNRAFGTST